MAFKRVFLLILIFVFVFTSVLPVRVYAAATITELINILIAMLNAWNVTNQYNSGADGPGQPLVDWYEAKLKTYVDDVLGIGMTAFTASLNIQSLTTGKLWIDNATYKALTKFANWLKSNQGWSDNGEYQIINSSGYNFADGSPLRFGFSKNYDNEPASIVGTVLRVGDSYTLSNGNVFSYTLVSGRLHFASSSYSSTALDLTDRGFNYYMFIGPSNGVVNAELQVAVGFTPSDFVVSNAGYLNTNGGTVLYGTTTYGVVFGSPSSVVVSVSTGTIGIPSDQAVDDLDPAIGAVLDVGAAAGASVTDVIDSIIPAVQAGTLDATLTQTDSAAIEDELVPDYGSAEDWQVGGLADVFPFCIPFDLAAFLGLLSADPVTPVWDLTLPFGQYGDKTITIDLTDFNGLAALFRKLELLGFIVFLAYETRNLIRS